MWATHLHLHSPVYSRLVDPHSVSAFSFSWSSSLDTCLPICGTLHVISSTQTSTGCCGKNREDSVCIILYKIISSSMDWTLLFPLDVVILLNTVFSLKSVTRPEKEVGCGVRVVLGGQECFVTGVPRSDSPLCHFLFSLTLLPSPSALTGDVTLFTR